MRGSLVNSVVARIRETGARAAPVNPSNLRSPCKVKQYASAPSVAAAEHYAMPSVGVGIPEVLRSRDASHIALSLSLSLSLSLWLLIDRLL